MNLRQRARPLHRSNTPAPPAAARLCWPVGAASAVFLALAPAPAAARTALGVFGSWAAFRDATPRQCYAIAAPVQRHRRAPQQPFVAVADRPARDTRSQLHVRLRDARGPDAPITLSIGDRHFRLIGTGADAWAADARADRAIVAAMRGGPSLSIETVDSRGRPMVDVYRLEGAATAIDAAALDCLARP